MYAFAPTGTPIKGTREITPGVACIAEGSFANGKDGITFDNSGGTEHFYDDQTTLTKDGQTVYMDQDGGEWTESQIVLHDRSDISKEELAYLAKGEGSLVVLGDDINRILYEVFEIDWDTSDEGEDLPVLPDLPTQLVVSVNSGEEDIDFANALSDRYGFCINSYGAARLQLDPA